MFQKSKDPITRIGLGIIGTIGVVLILIAGWDTFIASDTVADGRAETVPDAEDGPPVGPLPQVGDGQSREEVHETIEGEGEGAQAAEVSEGDGTEPATRQQAAEQAGDTVPAQGGGRQDTAQAEGTVPAGDETAQAEGTAPAGDDTAQTEGTAPAGGDTAQTQGAAPDEGDDTAASDPPPLTGPDGSVAGADAEAGGVSQAEGTQQTTGATGAGQATPGAQDQAQAQADAGAAGGGGARWSDEEMALLTADAEAGARVWNQCRACHVADQEQNRVGPHLVDVVGREVASVDGFGYSDALLNHPTEQWTPQELDAWIANPRDYAPGTTMSYSGLRNPEDRANLLTYLYEMQQGQ